MFPRHVLLGAIKAAGPKGLAARDAVGIVYDSEDGGPLAAQNCIYVMAHDLRRRGWITSEGRTHRARYVWKGKP